MSRRVPQDGATSNRVAHHYYNPQYVLTLMEQSDPYELMFRGDFRIVQCSACGLSVSSENRYYRNLRTQQNTLLFEVRSACRCFPACVDPFISFAKPESVWDSPGSITGDWFHPYWNGSGWEMQRR